ncbi:hypothetical protein H257_04226 [Aphanomyces astaci]|uniref:Uncharacterized protein n=1 Tax=Aphanomyces astaci TaxID=112090 RepID=W4GUZ9_APHAT|nr:hypothetical protein H257_04226 [Aphanomyces astaci]ETV83512.1 hypothetical protein H257_04226 [Aphanomyces astaci]|eukprot:XP_009826942.1 hypothetical protein H257_04226 [Aphanomyces astaci]
MANTSTILWTLTVRMRSSSTLAVRIVGGSMNIGVPHSSRGVSGVKPHAVLELTSMQDVRVLDCFEVKPSMIMLVSLSDGFSAANSSPSGVFRDVLTLLAVELA